MKAKRHKRSIRQLWTEWSLARERILDGGIHLFVQQAAIIAGVREAFKLGPGEVEGMALIGYCRQLKARVLDLEQMLEQMRLALHMRTVGPTDEQKAVEDRRRKLIFEQAVAKVAQILSKGKKKGGRS